jgi:dethiobiotin synthetase
MKGKEYFISGIDTDCGKTYITGLLGRFLKNNEVKVITSKHIQTGCRNVSEDIEEHRRIMGIHMLPEDQARITCPYIFTYPASPHFAAQLDNKKIVPEVIRENTNKLLETYDIVLTEGAGGLMVPITRDYLVMDYLRDFKLPLILVGSSKLGSINHTLMSFKVCKDAGIDIVAFIYNIFPKSDPRISESSCTILEYYLNRDFPNAGIFKNKTLEDAADPALLDIFR